MAEVLLSGRYRLTEQLGSGGMAVVWRAVDEVLGRQVAVKVPSPELAADKDFKPRLRAEAQAAARLSHPHIIAVHDYGESGWPDGSVQPFVVMELVEGATLRDVLGGGTALPWRQAATIAAQISMALAAAHERGIVHRDVSSSNVMLTSTGAKVLDFGISALIGESAAEHERLLGTPAYLAPERLRCKEVSPAIDVYAVGIILYRMLSGRYPWRAETPIELLEAHLRHDPAPLPTHDDLPGALARLCHRCLAKEPADRPASAELAARLAALSGLGQAPTAEPAVTEAGPALARRRSFAADGGKSELSTVLRLPTGRSAMTGMPAPPVIGWRKAATFAGLSMALIGLTAWAFGVGGPAQGNRWLGPARPAAAVAEPAQQCHVTFQVTRDDGRRFEAAITIQNGAAAQEPAQLRFPWPGDQRTLDVQAASWQQTGREVVLEPAVGASNVALAGHYQGVNALPAKFTFNGAECTSTVVGASAQPQPAEVSGPPQPAEPVQVRHTGPGKGPNSGSGPGGKPKGRGR